MSTIVNDITLDPYNVVQTAAQWAIDLTVYAAGRQLFTSDVLIPGTTDQMMQKTANGADVWSMLDYAPIGVSSNFFTGNQTQTANRVHASAGYNVAVKNTSGWAINDDVLAGTMFRVYNPGGDAINAYTTASAGRGLVAQSDGANGIGFAANAGGVGGIGIRGYGAQYGAYLNANSGPGTYGAYIEGTAFAGSLFAEGYSTFRNQYAPPASGPSFSFLGYGVTGGDTICEWRDGGGNQIFRIMGNGLIAATNIIQSDTFYVGTNGMASAFFPNCKITPASGIEYKSRGEIGVNYISHHFTSDSAVTTAGARMLEVDNFGDVLFSIDKDGHWYIKGLYDDPTGLSVNQVFTEDQGNGTAILKIKL